MKRDQKEGIRPWDEGLTISITPIDWVFRYRGIYGVDNVLPLRFMFLHPHAAASLRSLEDSFPRILVFSDMYRNAMGSRRRREKNRQRRIRAGKVPRYTGMKPGFSAHNYGLAFDLDVDSTLQRMQGEAYNAAGFHGQCSKADLDDLLRGFGWWCHRDGPHGGDSNRGHEDWHYNYFGADADRWLSHSGQKTSGGIEAKIQSMYGPFDLSKLDVNQHLRALGYSEDRDGVMRFQMRWTLAVDGIAGPITQRVMTYVAARLVDGCTVYGTGADSLKHPGPPKDPQFPPGQTENML